MRQSALLRADVPVLRNLHRNARRRAIQFAKHRREARDRQMLLLREHQSRHRRLIGVVAQRHTPAVDAIQMLLGVIRAARIAPPLLRQRQPMTTQRLIPRHRQFRLHHGLRITREYLQQHAATAAHLFPAMSQLHHRLAFALQPKREPIRPRADLQPRRAAEGLPFRIRKRQPLDHHALKKATALHEAHRLLPLVRRLRVPVANKPPSLRDHRTLPLALHRPHASRVEKHRLLPKL